MECAGQSSLSRATIMNLRGNANCAWLYGYTPSALSVQSRNNSSLSLSYYYFFLSFGADNELFQKLWHIPIQY